MDNVINLGKNIIYRWGYIMLPIKVEIPAEIKVEGVTYFAKKEFHISLLAVEDYAKTDIELDKFVSLTKEFLKNNRVYFGKFLNEFRRVNRDYRSSVVIMVEINGLKELLDYLSENLKINIEYPPTHITLYTLENGLGIGVNNKSDLEKLTKPVKLEICRGLISMP